MAFFCDSLLSDQLRRVSSKLTAGVLYSQVRYDYNSHMQRAGVAELKARLSSYLEQVKAGNEVLITDRGIPIARLVPLERTIKIQSRRKRLVRAGILWPGRGRTALLKRPPRGDRVGDDVLASLLAERKEQR
jgi:prevent-host-death family protein